MTVPGAVKVIAEAVARYGDQVLIGAGTVLDEEQARACIDAGARFIVAPIVDVPTIAACRRAEVAVLPGALSPTEVVQAWRAGADFVKVFPCSAVGGASYIKALKAPLPQIPAGADRRRHARAPSATSSPPAPAPSASGGDLCDVQAIRSGRRETLVAAARAYVSAVEAARADRDEMFESRRVLEVGVAGMAAERASSEDLAAIADAVTEAFASLGDPGTFLVHDITFHRAVAAASGNPILASLVEMVSALFYEQRRLTAGSAGGALASSAGAPERIYQAHPRARPGARGSRDERAPAAGADGAGVGSRAAEGLTDAAFAPLDLVGPHLPSSSAARPASAARSRRGSRRRAPTWCRRRAGTTSWMKRPRWSRPPAAERCGW